MSGGRGLIVGGWIVGKFHFVVYIFTSIKTTNIRTSTNPSLASATN